MKDTQEPIPSGTAGERSAGLASVKADGLLPAVADRSVMPRSASTVRWHWPRLVLVLAVVAGCAFAGFYWWKEAHPPLPPSIVWGNGRLEADEIDIDTKFAARVAEILADEGDMVTGGQVVARMDTRDRQASLKQAQAQASGAQKAIDEANNNVTQLTAQAILAQQEFDRTKYLWRSKRLPRSSSRSASSSWTARTRRWRPQRTA